MSYACRRYTFFCILVTGTFSTLTADTIELRKNKYASRLQHHNPQAIAEFNALFKLYDHSIDYFFDYNNHLPLSDHVTILEQNLAVLRQTINNPQFASIHHELNGLYRDFNRLITTLKSFIGTRNSIHFAWRMKKYRPLMPEHIRNRGDFAIFCYLRHRLKC